MSDSICLCGAQASYPHDVDCPYPCYRSADYNWREQRHWRRIVRLKLPLRNMRDYEEFHGSDRE